MKGFRVEGGPELAEALRALGKSAGKNVLRRVGRKRLEPMRDAAKANARRRSGNMADNVIVGTRLAPSQKGAGVARGAGGSFRREAKNNVTVYMGPGQHPQAITEEFGTFNQSPHPFMRPAFDAEADGVIVGIGDDLWAEIKKTAARAAKKAAKLLARGGGK